MFNTYYFFCYQTKLYLKGKVIKNNKLSLKQFQTELSQKRSSDRRQYFKDLGLLNRDMEGSPGNINLLKKRGLLHFDNKNYSASISDFESILKKDPNNFYAYYYLGRVDIALNKIDEAIDKFSKSIKCNQKFSFAYLYRGYCYLLQKKWEAAEINFGKAKLFLTDNDDCYFYYLFMGQLFYLKGGKEKEAERCFEKAITYHRDRAQVYIQLILLYNPRDIEKVGFLFKKALSIDPYSANIYILYSQKVSSGKIDCVTTQEQYYYLHKALIVDPENLDANIELASIQYFDDPHRAIHYYSRAIALKIRGYHSICTNSRLHDLYFRRADVLGKMGEKQFVIRDLKKVTELSPDSDLANYSKLLIKEVETGKIRWK